MYKLLALDMDGTLLDRDKKISEENVAAIKKAKEIGVKVVLTTGRPLKGILRYLDKLNLTSDSDYCITYNGSLIVNTGTKKVLSETYLEPEDLRFLYSLSRKLDVNIHALTKNGCISPKLSKYTKLEVDLNHIPFKKVDFSSVKDNIDLIKVMFVDEEYKLTPAANNLPHEVYEKYTVVRSEPFFLEFLNKKVNKGAGLKFLAEKLGIKQDEVISVGDAGNDIHMIKYAGLGVAMGNAFPKVKEIADYITLSNDCNGVAHVINKFILNA